jgi:uncharacterized membrane protein
VTKLCIAITPDVACVIVFVFTLIIYSPLQSSVLMSGEQETELFKTCRCSLAGGLILLFGIKEHL